MSFRTKALAISCAVCVAASGYIYSQRSLTHLADIRPELRGVTDCALQRSPVDFVVIDGGRTEAEHQVNLANGTSWISRSRHQDGAAIDVAALTGGLVTYSSQPYETIAAAFKFCSAELGVPIIWGGDWRQRDLMHFELDRRYFP